MNRHTGVDAYGQASDWLVGTIKRNPEALLVLGAGCALLMRGSGSRAARRYEGYYGETGRSGRWRDGLASAADSASDYASDIKNRVSDAASSASETASSYASSISDYAGEVGRNVSEQTSRLTDQARSSIQEGLGHVLREQPLALAVAGLAAGATLAALFPHSEIEDRALGPARKAVAEAASAVKENLMEAASETGEQLKQGATERGLSPEGLKDMAKEAADTFAGKVSGKSDQERSSAPNPATPSGRSSS
jgi:hypothetical protein